jgi:hypothetical protein
MLPLGVIFKPKWPFGSYLSSGRYAWLVSQASQAEVPKALGSRIGAYDLRSQVNHSTAVGRVRRVRLEAGLLTSSSDRSATHTYDVIHSMKHIATFETWCQILAIDLQQSGRVKCLPFCAET